MLRTVVICAKVIGESIKEEDARKTLGKVDTKTIDVTKFKELLHSMAEKDKKKAEGFQQLLAQKEESFEKSFEKFEKDSKKTVDDFVKWMKDSRVVAAVSERDVRKMFEDSDPKNVELEKFKKILSETAEKNKSTVEEYYNLLGGQASKFLDAIKAGALAFKDSMCKDK